METAKDKRIVITGRHICLFTGVICAVCGIYWLAQAILFHNANMPAILTSTLLGLLLFFCSRKNDLKDHNETDRKRI